jgi:hypothetical protein
MSFFDFFRDGEGFAELQIIGEYEEDNGVRIVEVKIIDLDDKIDAKG